MQGLWYYFLNTQFNNFVKKHLLEKTRLYGKLSTEVSYRKPSVFIVKNFWSAAQAQFTRIALSLIHLSISCLYFLLEIVIYCYWEGLFRKVYVAFMCEKSHKIPFSPPLHISDRTQTGMNVRQFNWNQIEHGFNISNVWLLEPVNWENRDQLDKRIEFSSKYLYSQMTINPLVFIRPDSIFLALHGPCLVAKVRYCLNKYGRLRPP